jgi:hypothetical protein
MTVMSQIVLLTDDPVHAFGLTGSCVNYLSGSHFHLVAQ